LIFTPVFLLRLEIPVILGVEFRFPRLKWIISVFLALLALPVLVYLTPFLPLSFTAVMWHPEELLNGVLHFELDSTHWKLLFVMFSVYVSAIVYHPIQHGMEHKFQLTPYALLTAPAVLVLLAADLFSVIPGLIALDMADMVINKNHPGLKSRYLDKLNHLLVLRTLSILLLVAAAVWSPLTGNGSRITNGHAAPVALLVLLAAILRFHSAFLWAEDGSTGNLHKYALFMNSTAVLALLFLVNFETSTWAANPVFFIIALMILLLQLPGLIRRSVETIFIRAFTGFTFGIALLLIYADPASAQGAILMAGAIILGGASLVFLQNFHERRHRIPVILFAVLCAGLPFSPTGLWSNSWSQLVITQTRPLLIVLLPAAAVALLFSLVRYLYAPLKEWPSPEIITHVVYNAGPIAGLSAILAASLWGGTGFGGGVALAFTAAAAVGAYALFRYQDFILNRLDLASGQISRLNMRKLIVLPRRLGRGIQQILVEAEHFLEGEFSFLWVLLILVVLALVDWR